MGKTAIISRILSALIALLLITYIVFANTTPINIKRNFTSNGKDISVPYPGTRIEKIGATTKQINEPIYFTNKMPFKFDHSKIKISYKNQNPDQMIFIGYKNQDPWHYNTQVLDYPPLDNLKLPKIGRGPYLYQKNADFKSIDDFFNNSPKNKVVGIFDYSDVDALQSNLDIPSYRPSKNNTSINVPMRGKTVMYAYLNNESFNMSFTKQDLNWYADPDVATISVYKGSDKVYDATIDDDGNATSNHDSGQPESVIIKNPGPGLPEAGVYKIVIDAPDDSVITNVTTNLHKLAFEGPLYVADNHEVYGDIVAKTKPSMLTTNAQSLSFRSDHGKSKTAVVDKQVVNISKANQVYTAQSTSPTTSVNIPNSDMIVNGSGYFAFSPDQFFAPTPFKILPINSASDVAQADFILTDYKAPKHVGEWLVAEREFDLRDAVMQNDQLSWIIKAPGLKENKRTVEYKDIEMTLTKKGWFRQ
jgi:hypothetical protein